MVRKKEEETNTSNDGMEMNTFPYRLNGSQSTPVPRAPWSRLSGYCFALSLIPSGFVVFSTKIISPRNAGTPKSQLSVPPFLTPKGCKQLLQSCPENCKTSCHRSGTVLQTLQTFSRSSFLLLNFNIHAFNNVLAPQISNTITLIQMYKYFHDFIFHTHRYK